MGVCVNDNLLLQSFIGIITIFIGFNISIIAWNTYKLQMNNQLNFLGIAFGFISFIDLFYILSYRVTDMININESMQLWMVGRYIGSITFLIVSLSLMKKMKFKKVFLSYFLVTIGAVTGVFYGDIFPGAILSTGEVAPFYVMGEILNCFIRLASMIFLRKNKESVNPQTYTFIFLSIGFAFFMDLSILFIMFGYRGFALVGSLFKLASFYFIYKSEIEINLKKPYEILKQGKERLEEESAKRVEVQKHVLHQEVLLQKIINSLEEAIVVVDHEYDIIYYNSIFINMFSIPSRVLQSKDSEYIVKYIATKVKQPRAYLKNVVKIYSSQKEDSYEIVLLDGRHVKQYMTPFEVYDIKGWVFSLRDISTRKKQQRMLYQSKKNYQQLLNFIPDAVLLLQGMKCTYANVAAATLLGYENPKELLGVDISPFFSPQGQDALQRKDKKIKESMEDPIDIKIINRKHKVHWVNELSSSHIQQNQEVQLIILRDVTKQRIAERLQETMKKREELLEEKRRQNQFKVDFYTNISHELKTPINIISALGHMLKTMVGEEEPKTLEYVGLLNKNCNRLIKIINNSIDLNKMELGYFTIDMEICNMIEIIEDITLSVTPYTEEKSIKLIFDTDVEESINRIDINAMERILLNLLSNAIKFTPPGGKIKVGVKVVGQSIMITIKDTGIGMKREKLEHIFDRFNQGEHTSKYNPRGSGVGLFLVKELIELQGGRILVESELGKGSTFQIILPIQELENQEEMMNCDSLSMRRLGYGEVTNIELSDLTI